MRIHHLHTRRQVHTCMLTEREAHTPRMQAHTNHTTPHTRTHICTHTHTHTHTHTQFMHYYYTSDGLVEKRRKTSLLVCYALSSLITWRHLDEGEGIKVVACVCWWGGGEEGWGVLGLCLNGCFVAYIIVLAILCFWTHLLLKKRKLCCNFVGLLSHMLSCDFCV